MSFIFDYRVREVLGVTDGDTFDFMIDMGMHHYQKERLRLIDMDTPEVYGRNADPVRGPAATEFSREWLASATGLTIVSDKYDHRGSFGRVLGRVFRDGDPIGLGEALAIAGHVKDGFGAVK